MISLLAVGGSQDSAAFAQRSEEKRIKVGNTKAALQKTQIKNDETALQELVREWANAVVHRDVTKLEKIHEMEFKGNAAGINFDSKMLKDALQSKLMEVAAWTIEDVKVRITGNTAEVSGRSSLTNAKYKNADFSGEWEWTSRFVKRRDGSWRAVASHGKLLKKN